MLREAQKAHESAQWNNRNYVISFRDVRLVQPPPLKWGMALKNKTRYYLPSSFVLFLKKYSLFKRANTELARLCTLIGRRPPGNKSALVNEVFCPAPTFQVAIRLSRFVFSFNCKHERMCKGLRPWVVHVQWGCNGDVHSTCLNGVGSLNVIYDASSGQ